MRFGSRKEHIAAVTAEIAKGKATAAGFATATACAGLTGVGSAHASGTRHVIASVGIERKRDGG